MQQRPKLSDSYYTARAAAPCWPAGVSRVHTHLSFRVAVAILVLVPQRELLGEMLLNLLVRHLLTNPLKRNTQEVRLVSYK